MRNAGFTLIELSVVLIVAGLFAAAAAGALRVWIEHRAHYKTAEAQEEITAALQRYVNENGRLPCPASFEAAPDSASFGRSVSTNCATGTRAGTTLASSSRGPVRIGAVPVRELNLPDALALDGWDRRFTYAVSARLADTNFGYDANGGAIDLVDGSNSSLVTPPRSGVFVLISHGRTGNGAYSRAGTRVGNCERAAADGENCNGSARFRAADYSLATGNRRFDQLVSYSFPDDTTNAMLICSKKNKFYNPDHPDADSDGCVGPPNCTGEGQALQWDGTQFRCRDNLVDKAEIPVCNDPDEALRWDGSRFGCVGTQTGSPDVTPATEPFMQIHTVSRTVTQTGAPVRVTASCAANEILTGGSGTCLYTENGKDWPTTYLQKPTDDGWLTDCGTLQNSLDPNAKKTVTSNAVCLRF